MATITVPSGPNTATVQVLDANGADITGTCTITATSSDPTVIQIGSPSASTPNVIPFTALMPAGTADILYDASNSAGDIQQTDVITVAVTAPASMTVTYGTVIATHVAAHGKKK